MVPPRRVVSAATAGSLVALRTPSLRRRHLGHCLGHGRAPIRRQRRAEGVFLQGGAIHQVSVGQPHPARADACRVGGPRVHRGLRDNLADAGRAAADVIGEPAEVVQSVVEMLVEVHALPRLLDVLLDPRQAPHSSWDGHDHASELPEQTE